MNAVKRTAQATYCCLMLTVIIGIPAGAFAQSVWTCISESQWNILLADAFFFPVGVIHGLGIWLGHWH